ncbi:WXG100-like domain-containing protein, partial [Streptomyces sp. NPDC002577]
MSIMIPPELGPIAKITVGQDFPTGNEDRLAQLGAVWNTTAQEINQLIGELNPATAATFESLAGAPADQFGQFVNQLSQTLPAMAMSAAQLGEMAENIALEIEYAKYMIILQLAWMAAEIAYLSATLFGAAGIPAVVAAGRFAIQIILRELFIAVVSSIVMQVGMDVAVQVIQFLKGDRTHWDLSLTKGAAEMGALGGALGGGLGQIMRHLAPGFSKSFLGNVSHGALTGLTTTGASNLIFGTDQDLGLGTAAGGLGGAISHGHTLRGGGSPEHVEVPKLDASFSPEMLQHAIPGEGRPGTLERPGQVPQEHTGQVPQEHSGQVSEEHPAGQRPGEEELDLPDAPRPFDASELPDPSPSVLVTDLPSVPGTQLPPLREQVESRVNELSKIARLAGLPETEWRPKADSVREASGSGDWGEAARRLHDFRTTVEHQVLDQRLADFRAHVENGFAPLRDLGVSEEVWRSRVEAVERAQRTGSPVLVDSQLKEYTDFVERHLPVEVVSENGLRSFDSGVEQVRRELATVSDPTVREALQRDLEWHEQVQQRLDRLAQSDPESDIMRRRTIAQQESARSPREWSQAREALLEYQQQRDLQRQFDDVRQGRAQ